MGNRSFAFASLDKRTGFHGFADVPSSRALMDLSTFFLQNIKPKEQLHSFWFDAAALTISSAQGCNSRSGMPGRAAVVR